MSPKEEVEVLMNRGMHLVEELLHEEGAFDPFAVVEDSEGDLISICIGEEYEIPEGVEAIDLLEDIMAVQLQQNKQSAIAIFSLFTAVNEEGAEMTLIQVGLEHLEEYSAYLYLPFEITNGEVQIGEMVASARESVLFNK